MNLDYALDYYRRTAMRPDLVRTLQSYADLNENGRPEQEERARAEARTLAEPAGSGA